MKYCRFRLIRGPMEMRLGGQPNFCKASEIIALRHASYPTLNLKNSAQGRSRWRSSLNTRSGVHGTWLLALCGGWSPPIASPPPLPPLPMTKEGRMPADAPDENHE